MRKQIEFRVLLTVDEDELQNKLKLDTLKYAQFLKETLRLDLTSKSFAIHHDVQVTIES